MWLPAEGCRRRVPILSSRHPRESAPVRPGKGRGGACGGGRSAGALTGAGALIFTGLQMVLLGASIAPVHLEIRHSLGFDSLKEASQGAPLPAREPRRAVTGISSSVQFSSGRFPNGV